MRRISVILILSFLCIAGLSAQNQFNLPQIVNGDGIQTTFLFFNNGSDTAMMFMTLRDDNGNPLPIDLPGLTGVGPGLFTFDLAPAETTIVQSSGQGGLQVGSASITATQPIGLSAIISLFNGGTEAGVGASVPLSSFNIAADLSANFNTGLAVQNLNGGSTTLTFTLFDSAGTQQGAPVNRDVPGNGHLAIFIGGAGGLFPNVSSFQGNLAVTSSNDVAALSLRQDLPTGVLTTLPVVATGSAQSSFVLPQVADGGGIKTTFVFFGIGQAAVVQLNLTQDDGSPLPVTLSNGQNGSQFNLNVPANGALLLQTSGAGGTPVTGAARVTSNAAIGVSAVFTIENSSGTILTEAGVGDAPALTEFTLPIDNSGAFNTGLALFNPNPGSSLLSFQFRDRGGVTRKAIKVQIDPFGVAPMGHIARFISELDAGLGGLQGSLAVTAAPAVSVLTLRQNTGTATLTTLPVSQGIAPGGGPGPQGQFLIPRDIENIVLTSNSVLDVELPGGFEIGGSVTLPSVTSLLISASALRQDGRLFGGAFQIQGGVYRILVPAGTYQLIFCYIFADPLDPSSAVQIERTIDGVTVNADVTQNVNLPAPNLVNVSGTIAGLGQFDPQATLALLFVDSSDDAVTGIASIENGTYTQALSPGNYTASLVVAETMGQGGNIDLENASVLFNVAQVNVAGAPVVANLTVPATVDVSGALSLAGGGNLPDNSFASAIDSTTPIRLSGCFAGQAGSLGSASQVGAYSMALLANRPYKLRAFTPVTNVGSPDAGMLGIPAFVPADQQFAADAVRNFDFPALPQEFTLTGRVTDPQGQPVADADVNVFSDALTGTPGAFFSADIRTDNQGNYSITVLSGTQYRISVIPRTPLP